MPVACTVFWTIVGVSALRVSPNALAHLVLFGSGMIFPFGALLNRIFYRRMKFAVQSDGHQRRGRTRLHLQSPPNVQAAINNRLPRLIAR